MGWVWVRRRFLARARQHRVTPFVVALAAIVLATFGSATPAFSQVLLALTMSKSFSPSTVVVGGTATTTMTVTITNPNPTPITGIAFSDTYPAGLVPDVVGAYTCAAGSAVFNGSGWAFSNVTLAAGASCSVPMLMHATITGPIVNTTSQVTGTGVPAGGPASATLNATSPSSSSSSGVPVDSSKLRTLQTAGTQLVGQTAGQTISGAIDNTIADGFSPGNTPVALTGNGMRFNFSAEPEPERKSDVEARVGGAFAALAYAGREPVYKAPPPRPKEWLAWGEVRGTGWNTDQQNGDIRGSQTHALLGLTRSISPTLLAGLFAGYETFNYTSQQLSGRLKGDGWTVGGYLGWKILPGVRFDAAVARSGVSYDGTAGTAAATFPGQRWLASTALTGTYRMQNGVELEPSARLYMLWEHEDAFLDSLGTQQTGRNFTTGRASPGIKATVPVLWSSTVTLAPYAGIYADYYFNKDNATATLLLPAEFIQGWSARAITGVGVNIANGPKLLFGGEVGGIGSGQFVNWTWRGRGTMPF
jgi:uncharacterized repeat protein (TIGR01451 family)